ncbi:uncharacterized protein BDR25DRAFT_362318 [Lindgomyces ingoldianus]|uniref:Uncharacterized protein n=2 Tax=Lindgomyces ingoldianus TaxID=673940 RepID=A0ACB6QBY4_9PLEO|nr:uncharacterized protein BDR25DRAFT_363647 [Lindgomyces ingoldianus]XP_033540731.1 uncharacterized protein BDR25DRAFT_362318 [Lindgomyces ingoldianus]KAF2462710.1 hypothetical protein BDR25DRAFT_363647 [Lindgomyces ingoldianus]KAF2463887.1 hypothetical protein BDR25DRAFT_362318 [Lindgomyces ingoldianus]
MLQFAATYCSSLLLARKRPTQGSPIPPPPAKRRALADITYYPYVVIVLRH